MLSRALPAAHNLAALSAPRAISTGNLRADCERWCRDQLPPRTIPTPRTSGGSLASRADGDVRKASGFRPSGIALMRSA